MTVQSSSQVCFHSLLFKPSRTQFLKVVLNLIFELNNEQSTEDSDNAIFLCSVENIKTFLLFLMMNQVNYKKFYLIYNSLL